LNRDAREERPTDAELQLWRERAAPADLMVELKAWLIYNAGTDLVRPGASLAGWLRKAHTRAEVARGCTEPGCVGGWVGEDAAGRPRPCRVCRPNVTRLRRGAS
jgi:hypothetical protein